MKYFKYLKYVIRHKWFVFIGCLKLGWGNSWFFSLFYRGLIHDWSKLRPSEFFPYAEYFYGKKGSTNREKEKDGCDRSNGIEDYDFDMAWLLHQKCNKHHWQYWMLPKDDGSMAFFNMPDLYLLEMVADWYGAGRAISGREVVGPWYETNKNKIKLSGRSRKTLETIIMNFDERLRRD